MKVTFLPQTYRKHTIISPFISAYAAFYSSWHATTTVCKSKRDEWPWNQIVAVETSAAPAAGRPPPRRLDVRRPGSWTSAVPVAGRPPPRRLDVRRPGGWTSAVPAAGRPPLRPLDVRRPGGWLDVRRLGGRTYAAPAAELLTRNATV